VPPSPPPEVNRSCCLSPCRPLAGPTEDRGPTTLGRLWKVPSPAASAHVCWENSCIGQHTPWRG
jgi:hypothetical protein